MIIIPCYYNITDKRFCWKVWPSKLALFVFVSMHTAEIVKKLAINNQLSPWLRGNASYCIAKGSGSISIPEKFYVCCFVLLRCVFIFLGKKATLFIIIFSTPIPMLCVYYKAINVHKDIASLIHKQLYHQRHFFYFKMRMHKMTWLTFTSYIYLYI